MPLQDAGEQLDVGELERVLGIEPDQLLIPTQHTEFRDRRTIAAVGHVGLDANCFQQVDEVLAVHIVPDQTDDRRMHAEAREVDGHVGSAAGARLLAGDLDDRHRGLRRNA